LLNESSLFPQTGSGSTFQKRVPPFHFRTLRLRTGFYISFSSFSRPLHGLLTHYKNLRAGHSPIPHRVLRLGRHEDLIDIDRVRTRPCLLCTLQSMSERKVRTKFSWFGKFSKN
jgi:hypothetical protein